MLVVVAEVPLVMVLVAQEVQVAVGMVHTMSVAQMLLQELQTLVVVVEVAVMELTT
jgi:hypothetical protein